METCSPAPQCLPSGVLIGSCPSSGSTLLSVLLDLHPQLSSGPELSMFAHPFVWSFQGEEFRRRLSFAQQGQATHPELKWDLANGFVPYLGFADLPNFGWYGVAEEDWQRILDTASSGVELAAAMLGNACQRAGKQIWCEKSPPNLYAAKSFLHACPAGKVLLMVRDGRDVVCSLAKRQFTTGEAAAIWLLESAIIRELSLHPSVQVIAYETLVQNPLATLNDIAGFLGVAPFTESMLQDLPGSRRSLQDRSIRVEAWTSTPNQGIQTNSLGRWRKDLPADDLALLMAHRLTSHAAQLPFQPPLPACGVSDVLEELGYPVFPERPKLSWERYFEYLLFDSHPFGHLTQQARFHRNYVRYEPRAIEPSTPIDQAKSVEIIENLLRTRIASSSNRMASPGRSGLEP